MDGVMARLPSTISLMARGDTPMALAMAFWEMPIGAKYSSSKISPGVIGVCMGVVYDAIRYKKLLILVLVGACYKPRVF